MMGVMRDDGAPFVGYPTTTNITQALIAESFDANGIVESGAFPIPKGDNATLNIFNVTSRVSTDAQFRCLDQATAYAGAQHGAFEDVYYYEFNRSYQLAEWSPNSPVSLPVSSLFSQ